MNRRQFFGLGLSLLSLPLSTAWAQSSSSNRVPGQFLVNLSSQKAPLVLARGVNPSRWQQLSLKAQLGDRVPGAVIKKTFSQVGVSLVTAPAGSDAATLARLTASLGAANVSYNYYRKLSATKEPFKTPEYLLQWQWPQIHAPEAWPTTTDASTVVVALIDSGTDLDHPDIKSNLWKNPKEIPDNHIDDDHNGVVDDVYGLNAYDETQPPTDEYGHGTHCAGLVGAVGDNKQLITGVCWKVKIMSLRFTNEKGEGNDGAIIRCLDYAIQQKKSGINLRVISCSFADSDSDPLLKAAYQRAQDVGLLSVCAAGNGQQGAEGHDVDDVKIMDGPQYPASYNLDSIISVASSERDDSRSYFSNYGGRSVDLAAPGREILSLALGTGTVKMDGTSMATPIVAGAAALISAHEPGLSALQLKARILSTVDPVSALKGKTVTGGRLNLYRALTNNICSLSGQVYLLNGTTKVPLVGALIKIKGKTLTSTDKKGAYSIPDLPPGKTDVTASLNGYGFNPGSPTLPTAGGNAVQDFPAYKAPPALYNISGYALDAGGNPVKGVSIFIDGTPNAVTTTESNGKYTITSRGKGTYKLSASSPSIGWTPSVPSVTVPTAAGVPGTPNGTINFSGTVPDTTPPVVTITTPVDDISTTIPAPSEARGHVTDASGVQELHFQLNRSTTATGEFGFYNWTSNKWVVNPNEEGVDKVLPISGKDTPWSLPFPAMIAGTYTLTVSAKDIRGNDSSGGSEVSSTFLVGGANAAKAAGTSTKPGSGNKS